MQVEDGEMLSGQKYLHRGLSDLSLITGFHKVTGELTSKSCSLTSTQNWPIQNA